MAALGGTRELERPRYSVIVDRISHEVPYYRAHLKSASILGTVVVNDPFWWEADEKFFECTLARKLGVAVPRTDRKSTRLNSSHANISYAVFCLKKKKTK